MPVHEIIFRSVGIQLVPTFHFTTKQWASIEGFSIQSYARSSWLLRILAHGDGKVQRALSHLLKFDWG